MNLKWLLGADSRGAIDSRLYGCGLGLLCSGLSKGHLKHVKAFEGRAGPGGFGQAFLFEGEAS